MSPDKLELTGAELEQAHAQEQGANDTTPDQESLFQCITGFFAVFRAAPPLQAKWPEHDADAPDYRHLDASTIAANKTFALTPDVVELLVRSNRFDPHGKDDVIALAFRGLALRKEDEVGSKHEVEDATSIDVTNVRPNHESYRCLLRFYKRDPDKTKRRLTLFSGSTVPNPYYMRGYYNEVNNGTPFGTGCKLMPTGTHCERLANSGR